MVFLYGPVSCLGLQNHANRFASPPCPQVASELAKASAELVAKARDSLAISVIAEGRPTVQLTTPTV